MSDGYLEADWTALGREGDEMSEPSASEIEAFLSVFNRLARFEAEQRHIRGYGCFDEKELHALDILPVFAWLRKLADEPATPEP